jgi:hypothetical protein
MVKEREGERHPFKLGEFYQGIAPCGTTWIVDFRS